jgi:hypothetical protein
MSECVEGYKITKSGKKILHPQPHTRIILLFGITVVVITSLYLIYAYYELILPSPTPPVQISFVEAMGDIEKLSVEEIDIPTDVEIEVEKLSEEIVSLTF